MTSQSVLCLRASTEPFVLIVEPWAEEFEIHLTDECQLVALHPEAPPSFGLELAPGRLVVCVNEGGSTYEFWRTGRREFKTSVAIPLMPFSGSPADHRPWWRFW